MHGSPGLETNPMKMNLFQEMSPMNRIRSFTARLLTVALLGAVGLLGVSTSVSAQTALTSTTLSVAVTQPLGNAVTVTANTGITAGVRLYVDKELMFVNSINTTTNIAQVRRGLGEGGTSGVTHAAGATVYIIPVGSAVGQAYRVNDPSGTCTATNEAYLPVINTKTGAIWDCVQQETNAANALAMSKWVAYGEDQVRVSAPRTAVAGVAYTIKLADYIVALVTTGTGSTGTSVAVQTWTLPSHVGHYGKTLVLKDESGGVTATTYIAINGTLDGLFNVGSNAIKTAYGGITIYAGSGGWFTVGCYGNGLCYR